MEARVHPAKPRKSRVAVAQPAHPHAHAHARVTFTPTRKRLFLAILEAGTSIGEAAKAAGVGRRTVYDARHRDPTFADAWDIAVDIGTDLLVERLRKIALTGPTDSLTTIRAAEVFLRARHSAFRASGGRG